MKLNLIIFILLFSLNLSSFAQTEQGSKFLGGSFEISTTTYSGGNDDLTSFTIYPQFGYFLQDRWAIGSGLGFRVTSRDDTDVFFYISPFTRYYLPLIDEKFYLFGQASISTGFGDDAFTFGFSALPGFAFFPTEKWSIELAFNLLNFSITNPEGEDNNITRFSLGTDTYSPSLGVNFFF